MLSPRRKTPKIRQIEFVSLSQKRILLILVSTDGDVQNRILFTERAYTQSELLTASNTLNEYFAGSELEHIRRSVRDDLARLRGDLQDLMEAALSASDEALKGEGDYQKLAEGYEAALGQHWLWGTVLAVLFVFGPGRWSADAWLAAMPL